MTLYSDTSTWISDEHKLFTDSVSKFYASEMIPNIENCVDAVENGVRGVVILDGRKPHSILHEIFSDTGSGTLIRK